jgi:hypothetical protein
LSIKSGQNFVPCRASADVNDRNRIMSSDGIDLPESVTAHVDTETAIQQRVTAHGKMRACDRDFAIL